MVDRIYPELVARGVDVHVAAELGESKPDRDVYLDACAQLDATPGRTAFVDDKAANVEGAQRAGLRAVRYEGVAPFAAFLRTLGLEPG